MARPPWSSDGGSHRGSRRLEHKAFCDVLGGCLPDLDLGHTMPDIPAVHDATCHAYICDCLVFVSFDIAVVQAAHLDTNTSLDSIRMSE